MTTSFRALWSLVLVGVLAVPLRSARAAPVDLEQTMAHARELSDQGRFAEASVYLAEQHAKDPQPIFLIGRAEAERRSGYCRVALELYREYVRAAGPNVVEGTDRSIQMCERALSDAEAGEAAYADGDPERAASLLARSYDATPALGVLRLRIEVEASLGRCRLAEELFVRLENRSRTDPSVTRLRPEVEGCGSADEPPSPANSIPNHIAPQPPRAKMKPVDIALITSGSIVAAVGSGLLVGGVVRRNRTVDDETLNLGEFRDQERSSGAMFGTGVALAAVGVGLVLSGVIHWAVQRKRNRALGTRWDVRNGVLRW